MKLNAQTAYDNLRQSLYCWSGDKRQGIIPVAPEGWECDQTLIVEKRVGLEGPSGCAHNTAKHAIVPAEWFGADWREQKMRDQRGEWIIQNEVAPNATNHPFLISTEQGETANHPESREFRNLCLDGYYRTSGVDIGGAHYCRVVGIGVFNTAHIAIRRQEGSRVDIDGAWMEARGDKDEGGNTIFAPRGYGLYDYKCKGSFNAGKMQLYETAIRADRAKNVHYRADIEHCTVALDCSHEKHGARFVSFDLEVQTCGEVPLNFHNCGEGIDGTITIRKVGFDAPGRRLYEAFLLDLDGSRKMLTRFDKWGQEVKLKVWSRKKKYRRWKREIAVERMR